MNELLRESFRRYQASACRYIEQMDPEDRTTFVFGAGDLVRRDLTTLEAPGRGLPLR